MGAFDPVAYLTDPGNAVTKPGLERISALLAELGDPQDGLRFVHVAGTNGKGSICAYLNSILAHAGLRVGLFSSPAFERFEDGITVAGHPISGGELAVAAQDVRAAAQQVEARLGDAPSAFELTCAAALLHFARSGCDICIMEVGMGGRLDATNVVRPDVCVIARIGFDHTEYLGETLGEIAAEKAGIVKPGARVVSWPQERPAMAVIEDICEGAGCALTMPAFSMLRRWLPDMKAAKRVFEYEGRTYVTGLLGSSQPENASVAIEAAYALRRCGWDIPDEAISGGIASAAIPGRFELLRHRPLVLVDGAHNPQGARALAESLAEVLQALDEPQLRGCFALGVLADKAYEAMIEPLVPFASSFVAYAPDNPRALSAEDLARAVRRQVSADVLVRTAPSAEEAAASALELAGSDGFAVAYGSLYSAARVRNAILSA